MIVERAAACVLVVVCVLQMLRPSRTIKPRHWQSIDVRVGRLRVQARNDADSIRFGELGSEQKAFTSAARMPLLHSWQKEPKGLRICIYNSSCITAWSDETSHAWFVSTDERDSFD